MMSPNYNMNNAASIHENDLASPEMVYQSPAFGVEQQSFGVEAGEQMQHLHPFQPMPSQQLPYFVTDSGIVDVSAKHEKFAVIAKAKKASGGHLMERVRKCPGVVKESTLSAITKPAIKRLARRGGVKRISKPVYDEIRSEMRIFIQTTLRDATTYCEHAKRKTLKPLDIVYALKRSGKDLYGYGM